MKIATVFTTLLLAIGWSICPIVGFIPSSMLSYSGQAVNGWAPKSSEAIVTHQQMTRNAIYQVAAEFLRANPNPSDSQSSKRLSVLSSLNEASLITAYYGPNSNRNERLFKDAVDKMQEATAAVDYPWPGKFGIREKNLAPAHFDAEQFESGQNRLIELRQSVVTSIKSGDYDTARIDSGRMFHTLQDFYSHSNWIENGNQAPNPVLGQPGQRIENIASPTQQTCLDNCVLKRGKYNKYLNYYDCHNNIVESLKRNKILTSGYVSDSMDSEGKEIKKPYGKCSHGGVGEFDKSQNLPARGGINKDSPYAAVSPHYYLHKEAAEVAEQATIDMLRELRRDVDNDLLFGAYLGVFENPAEVSGIDDNWVHYLHQKRNRNAMLQRHWSRIEGNAKVI